MRKILLPVVLALLLVSRLVAAQGTPADYERSNSLAQLTRDKVVKLSVDPNWIGGNGRFWYRNNLAGGRREFILVDPTMETKEPAFDHQKLATALTTALARAVDADRLPIDRLQFSEDQAEFRVQIQDKIFAVETQSYALRPETMPLPVPAGEFRGRRGRERSQGEPAIQSVSPDKKWNILLRDNNLILKDAQTGLESSLTTDGSPADRYEREVHWSPDSQKVVVHKTVPAEEHKVYEIDSSPRDQVQPKLKSFDYLKPGDRIAHPRPHLIDIASRKDITIPDELFPNPWELTEFHWQPDSSRFTFLYNQRGHQVMRLVSVDAVTGQATTIIDEQAKTFIDWTNKVYLHRLDATHEALWMSERDGWCHLYLYDTATGQVKNQITRGEWVVRGVDRVDEEKRQIWLRAGGIRPGQDPYLIHYARVNFDGSGLTILTEGNGTHRVTFSPNREFCVDTWSRVDLPPVSEVRRCSDGAMVMPLEKADASALTVSGWQVPIRFVAKGRDGTTDIYGVIFRPTNFDPAKKYPVVEQIYAGPQGAFVPKGFLAYHSPQTMAELGFIVVQIDGMGTNFRSKAFHDVCCKNLGDAGFPDRILWMTAAAAKYPWMDLTRVGIYGGSAGGQNALGGLLQHPDFYKVGAADCGCHDNRMDKVWWNEQWMGWPVGPHYAEQSNVTLAPKLKGKLLLLVGELDNNVDPASTMQVVDALIKARKDFDFLVVPGAGHGVSGSPYGRRKVQDFFVRNLLGVAPPDRNRSE